jgi:GAF domain-containing protein
MLEKIAALAGETIPGVDASTITMIDRSGRPRTQVATDDAARALDALQFRAGDGPTLRAIHDQQVDHLVVATDTRWPDFNAAAADVGIAAVMAAPLIDRDGVKGSLNLYTRSAFQQGAVETVDLFAVQLGVAAANAALYVERMLLAEQLEVALETRVVIEQAKGVLMGIERCSGDDAFKMLVRRSQRENRKLRDIAAEVVERYAGSAETR